MITYKRIAILMKRSCTQMQHMSVWDLVYHKQWCNMFHLDRNDNAQETNKNAKLIWANISNERPLQNNFPIQANVLSKIQDTEKRNLHLILPLTQGVELKRNKKISANFDDHKYAHGSKSILELIRAIFVFHICQIKIFVSNADTFANLSSNIMGPKLTNTLMKQTFFQHFCGGEDEESVRSTIHALNKKGIRSILDYAAENELITMDTRIPSPSKKDNVLITRPPFHQPERIYDFKSENHYDSHVDIFLSCIRTARNVSISDSDGGFAALKITALGNPLLLERMSVAITEAKLLFAKFDHNKDGIVTRNEFKQAYQLFFKDSDETLSSLLEKLDPDESNIIDYITWSQQLQPADLLRITSSCRAIGPLALATPSMQEVDLMETMRERVQKVANEAFVNKIRLLVDAEQTRFQPAIDSLVFELQKEYNCSAKTDFPIIFNTYQCYLKDVHERLAADVERSRRFSYHFAAKLVRGAYMVSERKRSEELGISSPIHDTIDDTHACFNNALEFLIQYKVKSNTKLEVMCATHNQYSIERTIDLMHELNIHPSDSTVNFAQLYGMKDNLTNTLGSHGFRAHKYVPYGTVGEVMPYLIRRAQENSDMLGNPSSELSFLYNELKQRLVISS